MSWKMSGKAFRGFWPALVVGVLAVPTLSVAEEPPLAPLPSRPHVVDAEGRSLGVLIGPNRVLVTFRDGDAVIGVDSRGYLSSTPGYGAFPNSYAYRSKDCSGTGFAWPFQTPTLAFFGATSDAEPGKTPAGKLSYAVRETFVMPVRSTLERWDGLCVQRDWMDAIVSRINSRDVPPFTLPLSIVVRPIDARAAPASPTPGAGVYDARGGYVGNLLDRNRVWMHFPDGDALVKTDPSGALTETLATLYFTTPDCTGPAWMDATKLPTEGGFAPIPSGAAVVSKGFIRYPRRSYKTITALSSRNTGSSNCMPEASEPIFAGRARLVKLDGFAPPMTIR